MNHTGRIVERSGTVGTGTWRTISRAPSAQLLGTVEQLTGFEEWSPRPLRRREVAQTSVTVIFNLGPPLLISGANRSPRALDSFIAGRLDLFGITEFTGVSRGLELKMTPFGARRILGIPMHELTDVVMPVEEVLGNFGRNLTEQIAATDGWGERFDLLEAAINRRISAQPAPSPDVIWAWSKLKASRGQVPIASLASGLGCSRRHLSARFRDHLGVTPKVAGRVLRFRHCVAMLERDDGNRYAEIAARSGYYDQPHMNREFRALAGTTPGSFVASRLAPERGTAVEPQVTFVQDKTVNLP
jgi:AraC-like DNA-binding protein